MSTPIEHLRKKCLERGVTGIRDIGRMFRAYDKNRDVTLDKEELGIGLRRYGLTMTADEVDKLFACLDKDASGSINFDELLISLRPTMVKARMDVVEKAFSKLDKTGDGMITMTDIKGQYRMAEGATEKTGMQSFLNSFQSGTGDDQVTKEEFINYYSGVSASVDNDEQFIEMLTQEWEL